MLLATSFQLQLEMLDDLALVKKFFWKVGRWNVGWVLPWCFYANTPRNVTASFPWQMMEEWKTTFLLKDVKFSVAMLNFQGVKPFVLFVNHSSANPREVVKMSLLTAQGLDLGNLQYTPRKFNIAPKKWWLEDESPFGKAYFQGLC